MITAAIYAQRLMQHGIQIASHSEGDDEVDGEIVLKANRNVTVQIPFMQVYGVSVSVWQSDDHLLSYPARRSIQQVIADIKNAMTKAAPANATATA